ncbi:alpha-1,2-fucosyltransferase [Leeuwenhoekiella polynyae]|uniref:Glycosyl transferase family 11 n=1 Tax=Leeuwenhoekiella polynyae TaxID=1550906 RepID=A0A4V1KRP3_9FLAO|nr:alpha-1,2-fucosyltransferase [Leeuwenhoekiella polynyae]RXG25612.1 glycosyl transferase family 11 [Leeuwenhoekiella polynyae]
MIITVLSDRLGNQLFQYAAGKALAVQNGTEHKLSSAYYQKDSVKDAYELKHFNINETFVTPKELKRYTWTKDSIIYRILRKIYPKKTYFEPSFEYDPHFKNLGNDVCLRGFWQSYKYFEGIGPLLRDEFQIRPKLEGKNLEMAKLINTTNSVAVHIRRGDYLKKQHQEHYEICSLAYYQNAIKLLSEKMEHPTFFFFSDTITWVKENLSPNHPHHYIDFNTGENAYDDLRLMSLCKANIIANSTFSWWGAWLNAHTDKTVIAPKKWFKDPSISLDDLYPEGWIRL